MKSHVTKGAEILKSFTIVDHVEEGALYHHERYDGKGYVHGLKEKKSRSMPELSELQIHLMQ